ncbi:hypothetical protein [Streptomyces qinzhouensis]|uniref:hypothetical protein n=1 Tax=Streptomyces qinzhouensis TaxID=2599401 RepID=UPI001FE6F2BE|nr:hypothetical protein [Streptomyces qinzhouensis]
MATALSTAWFAPRLLVGENGIADPANRLPLVLVAPLVAAVAIGTGLHTPSDELDRSAARAWWRPRLLQLLGLTGLAAGSFALAVTGSPELYGSPAAIRNLLGCTGIVLLTAVVAGAGAGWLPAVLYTALAYLLYQDPGSGPVGWVVRPGPGAQAWTTAVVLYVTGAAAWLWRGARRGTRPA